MQKTAMAVMNEFCSRNKAIPHYEMELLQPSKYFTCNLSFTNLPVEIKTFGKAKTKQTARHLAAYEALKIICNEDSPYDILDKGSIMMENVMSPQVDDQGENYLKKLKAICSRNMLPAPDFVSVPTDDSLPKTHAIKCNLSTLSAAGAAQSKKLAKQQAAYFMIKKLLSIRRLHLTMAGSSNYMGPEHQKTDENNNVEFSKQAEDENLTHIENYCRKTSFTYSRIKIGDYNKVSKMEEEFFPMNYAVRRIFKELENTPIGDVAQDPILIIKDIGRISEHKFEFSTINRIKNRENNEFKYVALHCLSTPPFVVLGKGKSVIEAQTKASIKMLKFLKDMVIISYDKDKD